MEKPEKPNEYNVTKREKIYKNIRNINRATVILGGVLIANMYTGVLPVGVTIACAILPALLQVVGGIYQHKMGITSDEDQKALEEEFKGK